MNTISSIPLYRVNSCQKLGNNLAQSYNTVSFKGAEKVVQKAKSEPVIGFAKQLYGFFFTRGFGKVKMIKDGKVYTEKVEHHGKKVVANKFSLWGKQPEMTVVDNYKKRIRTKTTYNADKTKNIEISDMHDPNYRVSVGYSRVSKGETYDGPVSIHYCDKSVKVSPEERAKIIGELNKDTAELELSLGDMHNLKAGGFQEYLNKYYQNPSVIGRAILTSPDKLEQQIDRMSSSIPYGIEAILEKMGK